MMNTATVTIFEPKITRTSDHLLEDRNKLVFDMGATTVILSPETLDKLIFDLQAFRVSVEQR